MKNLIKALMGLSVLYVALVITGDLTGFAGGIAMQRVFGGQWAPEAGHTYPVTTNGKTYNVKVLAVAASHALPEGYSRSGMDCVNGSALETCTAGVEVTFTNTVGQHITYTTPSHASRIAQYKYNHTVQPGVFVQPSASWIRENEAFALFGGTVGGPSGPPDDTGIIDITPLPNGDFIIDFAAPFGIYSIIVGPLDIT